MTPTVLPIALTIAAAAAVLHIWLAGRVSQLRNRHKVSIGDGGNEALIRRMRAHANYGENMPIVLILLALIELAGGDARILWAAGIALHEPGRTPRETLKRADAALYAAKDAGRDCDMLAAGSEVEFVLP